MLIPICVSVLSFIKIKFTPGPGEMKNILTNFKSLYC